MIQEQPQITYAARPWIKHYDPGVPASLEPYPRHPLYQFLREAAQKYPNTAAILTSAHLPAVGRQKAILTYHDLDAQSDALAVALLEMGVRKGDRVALILPNCAQFAISFYAILKVGGIVCAMNPTYPATKMQDQLNDCGATTAITLSLYYNMLKQIQKNTSIKNVVLANIKEYMPAVAAILFTAVKERSLGHYVDMAPGDHRFADLIKQYAGRKPDVSVQPEDAALFQYTGGTTGVPKGAIASHAAVVANTIQSRTFLGTGDHEVMLVAIPMFHVYGIVVALSIGVSIGATLLMVHNPRETTEILEIIDKYRPTLYPGVPGMFNAINNHPDVKAGKYDLSSLHVCFSGSAPLPPMTKRTFESLTHAKLIEGYGMSETPSVLSGNPVHGETRDDSIGVPLPDTDIRIVSLEDGKTDLPVGETGEMVVCGPQLMSGYYHMPDETDHALRLGPDGRKWFYTGDIGRMDADGYFYIVDRKKDMALIGGFNVYPANVEKILMEHPSVQDVGVASVPHPTKEGQEALKAWVILKAGRTCTEAELIDFCSKYLARYEVPTRIQFMSELPKTTVGKVLRRELINLDAVRKADSPSADKPADKPRP